VQYPSGYPPPQPPPRQSQRPQRKLADPTGPPPDLPYKSLFGASVSLLAFSTLTGLAIAAWFSRASDPWTWKSVLAIACTALGIATSALVWRRPSRESLLGGMAVMLLSLLRVGPIGEWTWVSAWMVVGTLGLLAPLVHALLLLPRA
jgi:hypothetical protein